MSRRSRPKLDGLDVFLDGGNELDERAAVLNHPRFGSDEIVTFLEGLEPEWRELALSVCTRPQVLTYWAVMGTPMERVTILCNAAAPEYVRELAVQGDQKAT
jgi:hypothetical protein